MQHTVLEFANLYISDVRHYYSESLIFLISLSDDIDKLVYLFRISLSLEPDNLAPSDLFVGEKTLIYLHVNEFDIFNSFWYGNF